MVLNENVDVYKTEVYNKINLEKLLKGSRRLKCDIYGDAGISTLFRPYW